MAIINFANCTWFFEKFLPKVVVVVHFIAVDLKAKSISSGIQNPEMVQNIITHFNFFKIKIK